MKNKKSFTGFLLILSLALFSSCTKNESDKTSSEPQKELWVYTSLYKDTIEDLTPKVQSAFPGLKVNWYQAGSEDIAAKVNAEMIAGQTKADVLISSDRFWYEEMGTSGRLHAYKPSVTDKIPASMRNSNGYYTTLSIPVMVMAYNNEAIKKEAAPKTFKEMTSEKWKGKFTTGSPLASGTNFTTVAMLQHHYGWDYIKGLRKNETISQGGNSSVLRRIQSEERPVGWVLLENLLRFQNKDKRLEVIYPEDGVVLQSNVIAITKKESSRKLAEDFVEFMYSSEGQNAMIRSYMYSPIKDFPPPKGAPDFSKLIEKSFPWTDEFIQNVVKERVGIKEKFAEIMFE